MKVIAVEISETGETKLDLKGFHGKGCGKVFEDFAAGSRVVSRQEKPEFFQAEQAQTNKAGGA